MSFISTGGRPGHTHGQEHFVEAIGALKRCMNCRARFSAVSFSRLMIKAQAIIKRRDGAKALSSPFSEGKILGEKSLLKSEMNIHFLSFLLLFNERIHPRKNLPLFVFRYIAYKQLRDRGQIPCYYNLPSLS